MSADAPRDATQLLILARRGEPGAADELFPLVYGELRMLAESYLGRERPDHTLQPTALVHEAYLRLIDGGRTEWNDRTHFFRAAAQSMRRVLVDHARARRTAKRGGGMPRLTLSADSAVTADRSLDVLALEESLNRLEQLNERHARIVELRFFAGMTIDEAATAMGLSATTLEEDWAMARAWLRREFSRAIDHDAGAI